MTIKTNYRSAEFSKVLDNTKNIPAKNINLTKYYNQVCSKITGKAFSELTTHLCNLTSNGAKERRIELLTALQDAQPL